LRKSYGQIRWRNSSRREGEIRLGSRGGRDVGPILFHEGNKKKVNGGEHQRDKGWGREDSRRGPASPCPDRKGGMPPVGRKAGRRGSPTSLENIILSIGYKTVVRSNQHRKRRPKSEGGYVKVRKCKKVVGKRVGKGGGKADPSGGESGVFQRQINGPEKG